MPYRTLSFFPPVLAHRGASVRAPENTMPAFVAAREDGARWIETDIKLTSDGVPVLFHDDTLDRTTNGRGPVADTTWADLSALDAGSWFGPGFAGTRVPSLAELVVFARDAGMRLNLELKPCPGRTQVTAMVALIEAAKEWPESAPPPLISSFDTEALVIASRLHPGWPRGLLFEEWREDWRELATLVQATSLHFLDDLLTPERLDLLREAHAPVLAFTVDDPARARELLRRGVRAVFTNRPAEMIRFL